MPGIVKGVVNPNVLNAFTALHWEYAQFLEETPEPWSDLILEEVPASPMLSDQFFIDLTTGGFRPWNGDRQMRDTMQDSFTVNKRAFEDSMKIPKLLAMNGVYQAMARSEAQRFASNLFTFRDDMANNMLRNGSSATLGKCWDGGAFFSATHPIDTRGDLTKVFSNKIALSGFTAPNWATVKAQLESVPAPNGKPYRAMVTGIIYPPAREPNIKAVFGKEHLTGGESNEYFNDIDTASRRKAIELADLPNVVYIVLSVAGRAKPLPYVQTPMNTMTLGEESEECGKTGYVSELADFYASCGYANPRLIAAWDIT